MTITVYYTAQSRQAAGCDHETVELPDGAAPIEALEALARRHGEPLRRILLADDSRPRAAVAVFVNDTQLSWQAPPRLKDGDRLMVLSPISGG